MSFLQIRSMLPFFMEDQLTYHLLFRYHYKSNRHQGPYSSYTTLSLHPNTTSGRYSGIFLKPGNLQRLNWRNYNHWKINKYLQPQCSQREGWPKISIAWMLQVIAPSTRLFTCCKTKKRIESQGKMSGYYVHTKNATNANCSSPRSDSSDPP